MCTSSFKRLVWHCCPADHKVFFWGGGVLSLELFFFQAENGGQTFQVFCLELVT